MLGRQLERVDDPQHLVEVAASSHWVDEDQLDLLVGPDHEDVPDRLIVRRGAVCRVSADVCSQHPVSLGDFEVRIADDRVVRRSSLRLFDVLGPSGVLRNRVD